MKKSLILVALIAASFTAVAEQHEVSWTAPDQREDNSPLTPAEIAGFNVLNALDGTPFVLAVPGSATSVIYDFPFGQHKVVVTATDTDGRESVYSQIITIDAAASPKAVTNLQSRRVTQ